MADVQARARSINLQRRHNICQNCRLDNYCSVIPSVCSKTIGLDRRRNDMLLPYFGLKISLDTRAMKNISIKFELCKIVSYGTHGRQTDTEQQAGEELRLMLPL